MSNRGETRPDLLFRILFENDRDRDRRFIGSDFTNLLIGCGIVSPYKIVIRRRRNLIHHSNARLKFKSFEVACPALRAVPHSVSDVV